MRACDIKENEFVEYKRESDRYGFLRVAGIIEANSDHSTNWKYRNEKKVPYITIVCEHFAFSIHDYIGIIRRIRPRDIQKDMSHNFSKEEI